MVHVCHTRHSNERVVVEEPSNDWVDAGIMDMIDVNRLQFCIASLPSYSIEENEKTEDAERSGGNPVHEGIAEQEIFDNCLVVRYANSKVQGDVLVSSHPHIRRPTWSKGHCHH